MDENFYSSKFWKHLRAAALERDKHQCQMCEGGEKLLVHHFRPRKLGGPDELFNLITVCTRCHGRFHAFLNTDGLDFIWGPNQEPYRHMLTSPWDEAKTIKRLEKQFGHAIPVQRNLN